MCAGSVVQKPDDHRGKLGGVAVVAIFLLRFEFLQKNWQSAFRKIARVVRTAENRSNPDGKRIRRTAEIGRLEHPTHSKSGATLSCLQIHPN
jgi:hypothetical protein